MKAKLLSALLALPLACVGQDISGSIAGTILDPSGAGVAGATVTITDTDRNAVVRTATTDGEGNYSVSFLQVGKYSVAVEMKGFKRAVAKNITLNVSDKLTVNLTLEVGDVQQEITVEATPTNVELQTAVQSTVINGTQIRELSLVTRNYEQLVTLMPGVSQSNGWDQLYVGTTLPSGSAAVVPFAINGARNSSNAWLVDGADNVDRGSNQTLLNTPSIDAIAEFKVQRSGYSAEFGRAGGGMISVVTKSGTSQFHGDLYEFVRNNAFAANNFLNNANKVNLGSDGKSNVAPLHYNNFGWTLGGPVLIPGIYGKDKNKNRTFFFFSEEFRRYITYTSSIATLPTAAELTGAFPHPVCASYTGSTCNQVTQQITNIDPTAKGYIQDIYSKVTLPVGTNTITPLFRNIFNFEQELVRVDHQFNQNHAVFVRFLRDSIPTTEPQGIFSLGVALPGVGVTQSNAPGRNWTGHETSSFSPTLVNEVGASYSYGAILSDPVGLASKTASPDIKPNLPFPVTLNLIPTVSFTGGSTIAGYGPYRDYNRNIAIFDNLTKVHGSHTLKFGATYYHYQKTENAASGNQGSFAFTTAASLIPAGGASTFEQAFANFLTGNVATYSQSSLDITPDIRANQWEFYAQDDWRISPNFTLNLGVRYSLFRQPVDVNNFLTTFDPSLYNASQAAKLTSAGLLANTDALSYLNGISINGKTSPFGAKVASDDNKDWAPRVGFAWDPFKKGKTSIRGGYGISYDATLYGTFEQNIFNNPPYVNSVSINNTTFGNPGSGTATVQNSPKALRGTTPDFKTPYTQQWSLDIQHQITPSTILTVGYVGTKGTHLLGIVDENTVVPGLAYTSGLVPAGTIFTSVNEPILNQLRPFQGYNAINVIQPWFNSNYNALQVYGQKRFKDDSMLSFAYTWSKNLTDAQTDRSSSPQNFYNRHEGEYGPASYDRRHVFSANFVYHLPFFRAQQGFVGKTLGGWEASVVTYFETGLPNTITTSGTDPAALGIIGSSASSLRPDQVCDPNGGAPHTRAQWFNTNCFAAVPTGVIRPGNAGRGTVLGPGFERVDLSLMKNFKFKERYSFQLRGEATNLFNHTNPNAIGTAVTTTSTYGQITSYRDPRIIQLGAKLYF